MDDNDSALTSQATGLSKYLSPLNVWALSLGCAIGWGAFVMPGTTLLPTAGPAGTLIAMAIGAAIMIVVAANFHYLLNRYPDSGGAFAFTRNIFGYDHAFLCFWALILAYVSILWANATAFVLIIRFLFGPVFQVGFHYEIAGYDVYFGEVVFTLAVLWIFGAFSCMKKRVVNLTNTTLAIVLLIGVVVCFGIVAGSGTATIPAFEPAFAGGEMPGVEIFGIVALAPWAYLGFESVSHAAGECAFPQKKMFRIMLLGVVAAAVIYMLTTMMSVLGTPSTYSTWSDYIADLGNLQGLDGLPTFHAMQSAMGPLGVTMLAVVVLAAVSTSLIGLYRASSRLIYTAAQEEIFPARFAQLNADGVPRNAILFLMAISTIVPFVGRAAIGWIVDVTSVSAAIVYGYASACSLRLSREEGNSAIKATSIIGLVSAAVFLVYPLVPNIWSVSALAPASYLILAAWGVLGLVFFRIVFHTDKKGHFGKSTVVWIFMLFLIFFSSTMWVRQITDGSADYISTELSEYYEREYIEHGVELDNVDIQEETSYLNKKAAEVHTTLMQSSFVQIAIIVLALVLMFDIYSLMLRRERKVEEQRLEAQQSSKAKTTFLSNMSHDIRTPMNAIIGYTHLARREDTTPEEAREYLEKIDASSKHLLALINDVLEMSRIESGKMELEPTETNICKTVDDVRDMFATQMREKNIEFVVDATEVRDKHVMIDANRLNRVLLNLVSNSYKFTPRGGTVSVTLSQLEDAANGQAPYQLRVKDSGIGMTEEFASRVFEAFERERNSTVDGIQGTGLGMAITKNIVDLMNGSIEVETAPGKGTEFIINVNLEVVDADDGADAKSHGDVSEADIDFIGKRMLLVEDNEINREIATFIFEDLGFEVEEAEDGKVALDKVSGSQPGYYDVILMDVQMPVMNGYEATKAIRALDNPELARIPIVAASANAFSEDVQASRDAGMDAHLAKPLDIEKATETLYELL